MKTKLQLFAEQIAADVTGLDISTISGALSGAAPSTDAPLSVNRGIDIPSIIALVESIMEVVMSIMNKCPAKRPALLEAINAPSRIQRVLTRIEVSQVCARNGLSARVYAGQISEAMFKRAAGSQAADVDAVLDDTLNVENWI